MINFPKLLSVARQASLLSDHHTHHLGAVLFDSHGRIISTGNNWLHRTHPLLRKYHQYKTLHAEVDAILCRRYKRHYSQLNLLIFREHRDGTPALAKPCEMCIKIMKLYRIHRVYYTTDNGIHMEDLK